MKIGREKYYVKLDSTTRYNTSPKDGEKLEII